MLSKFLQMQQVNIFLSCILLLLMLSCNQNKNQKTLITEGAPDSNGANSLSTSNNNNSGSSNEVNKWLIPLISEYLIDDTPVTPPVPTELVITEVSSAISIGDFNWVEIYNPTAAPINLSDYQFRSLGLLNISPYTYFGTTLFNIPSLTLQPGDYGVIIGQGHDNNSVSGPKHTYILNAPNTIPYWGGSGFVELVKNGATVDYVRFGNNVTPPLTPTAWQAGTQIGTFPSEYGHALVRDLAHTDTDTANDWSLVNFPTAGGPNDVPVGATDTDTDGIPDTSEVSGSTYAGIDLYAMGARTSQRDIFIEIDYMNTTDEGVIPRQEALDMVVASFAAQGIAVHFDVDDVVPLANGITLPFGSGSLSGLASFFEYKSLYMDINRRNIFHYLLFACSQNTYCNSGSSGYAEIKGNDLIVSMGGWGLNSNTTQNKNILINYQAGTIMHELGHNLDLQHGGNENVNDKPNYYSVMNYLYQLRGLPNTSGTGTDAPDRYYRDKGWKGLSFCGIANSPCGSYLNYIISYSDGSGSSINENSINEQIGIGRDTTWVDYDNSNTINTPSYNINGEGGYTTLTDYDDWGNLLLPFQRYWSGNNGATPNNNTSEPISLFDDSNLDTWIIEETPSDGFFETLSNILE